VLGSVAVGNGGERLQFFGYSQCLCHRHPVELSEVLRHEVGRIAHDLAGGGCDALREDAQQCGFAYPVATDQGAALAAGQGKTDVGEEHLLVRMCIAEIVNL
jgi:hypothetical protein